MKLAKLSLVAAVVLGGLVACSNLATAQDAPKGGGKKGMSIEQQMERLDKEVKLKDDQKPKVKALLEETDKKRKEVMQENAGDRQAIREKMRPIFEDQNKKMKEILTDEQYKKYEEMMQQQRRGGKGGKKGDSASGETKKSN